MKTGYLHQNYKTILQYVLTFFCVALAAWFFAHEKKEIQDVSVTLQLAGRNWLAAGIILTFVYVFLQAEMYRQSFKSADASVSLLQSGILFLKRNFISVFLPAGGISSLAFFSSPIEKQGVSSSQVTLASSIYGFTGILTVVVVAVPTFIYALFTSPVGASEWLALGTSLLLILAIFLLFYAIREKGTLYEWLIAKAPALEDFLNEIASGKIHKKHVLTTVGISLLIEFTGIAHLYIAVQALHADISLLACTLGYIIAVIFMLVSPFLRGMGAVELSMTYLLFQFGMSHAIALSVILLYRFYEFWLPLIFGLFAFLIPVQKLVLRILPALFLFLLATVNLMSVLTPALKSRLHILENFLPLQLISASNYLVFASGIFLVVTAVFLLKGLKNAWYFALLLTVLSGLGHITKGIDYEEASLAAIAVLVLVLTRKQYNVHSSRKLGFVGLRTAIGAIGFTLLYGIIGFYLLDKVHFGIDFSFYQSVEFSLKTFFLIDTELLPKDNFAISFLNSISFLGFSSLLFLFYTLVRPYLAFLNSSSDDLEEAREFLKAHGSGSLDYFKTYGDKNIFWSEDKSAFISYKIAGMYAIVLETPVAATPDAKSHCIAAFDKFCYRNGLRSIYYRINEADLLLFKKKKKLFLGQEAVVKITDFSLEGGHKKAFRNSIKKIKEAGYATRVYEPPIENHLLAALEQVSDDWLQELDDRKEMVFSQGLFDETELKQHTLITLEDVHGRIVAFLNTIPDYSAGEGTYDLIRKTTDAPSGAIDYVLISLFFYLQEKGYTAVNLGMAPMSGMTEPKEFSEKSIKFAYERIKAFSHYKGLRDYKEKFAPDWNNQYLLYENDYDLIGLPQALNEVFKP